MMIRINLLPVRAAKKRETGRQVLVLFAALVLLTVVGNYLWLDAREKEKQRGLDQIAATEKHIKDLEKVIGEVNNINARKKELEDKLRVLDELRKGRAGPVKFLDALSTATPQKVWISGFEESGGNVHLLGVGLSHEDVADFMRSLSSMVWTKKGMGRLVEQKRDAQAARVELLNAGAEVVELPVGEIGWFFRDIELKMAQQGGIGAQPVVNFEITFSTNYAI